jgi:ABC-type lipoprotein export system ATPase subunit
MFGYVPQDDILHPTLTVREHVLHSAVMRLPKDISFEVKSRIVDYIIESLGLSDKAGVEVGDVGKSVLSGGQRKRASICMELTMLPSVLFLDEPTSGLDSKSALALLSLLKEVVVDELGINTIAVLHQPRMEILDKCDNIVVMHDGRLAYAGPPALNSILPVFPPLQAIIKDKILINLADLILDEVQCFAWKQDPVLIEPGQRVKARSTPSFLYQLRVLTYRSLTQNIRSISLFLILYGLTILTSLILGIMFNGSLFVGPPMFEEIRLCPPRFMGQCSLNQKDTYLSQASMFSLALGLCAISSSLLTFGGSEKVMFNRETLAGQNRMAYYLSKEIVSLPNLLVAPVMFIFVFQMMTLPTISLAVFWVIVFGVYFSFSGAAHFISVSVHDSKSIVISVIYIAITSSLGGSVPTLNDLKIQFGNFMGVLLPALSPNRWALEAFYLGVTDSYKDIYDLNPAFFNFGYKRSDLLMTLLAPLFIGLGFRLLTAHILWRKRVSMRL